MTTEVEWRRRWKPDFSARPWRPFTCGGENFLIKTHFTDNNYELLITDSVMLWHESLDEDRIKKRTKKLNPHVEAPLRKLLDHLRENVEEKKKGTEHEISYQEKEGYEDDMVIFNVNTKLAGLPFTWKFYGLPAGKDLVSKHLTSPLLCMVGELSRRQQELYKLLKNKDKEIEDYKSQGVRVSRKHLETGAFDETVFTNNMDVSKGLEDQVNQRGFSAFDSEGQNLYRQILTKDAWIHRGPQPALEGESLMDEGSVAGAAGGSTGQSWANRLPPSLAQPGGVASPKKSPAGSPVKSPAKSPSRTSGSSAEPTPVKDTELLRRQALERRLQEEAGKKEQKEKKKKKIKF